MAKQIIICNSCLKRTGKKRKINVNSRQSIWDHKRKYTGCTYSNPVKVGRRLKQYEEVDEEAKKRLMAKRKKNQNAYEKRKKAKKRTESTGLSGQRTESTGLSRKKA